MRIATIDGVKHSLIQCTISLKAQDQPLTGQFVIIRVGEETLLGRLGPYEITNPVHTDPAFKPYIKTYGKVEQWSKEVDIKTSTVDVVSAITTSGAQVPLSSVPLATGTDIEDVHDDELRPFYNEAHHYLTVGTIPHSQGLPATLINRHFGPWEEGGYGEARHALICGQNGSGKTVFATVLLVGKLAAHPHMGLLMPDTAGDLSDPTRHNRGSFKWNWMEALKAAAVRIDSISIGNVRLTSAFTFQEMFASVLHDSVNTDAEHSKRLARDISEVLFEKGKVDVALLSTERLLLEIQQRIESVYSAAASKKEKREEALRLEQDPARRRGFEKRLDHLRVFFDGRENLDDLINGVLYEGRKVVIRMDSDHISGTEQAYVMQEIMDNLQYRAAQRFKSGKSCNALVVLDEGTRWVPEGQTEEGSVADTVKRAYRETRKYGLGWMVIAQRISEIAKTVLTQAHMKAFGKGLGIGTDRKHMEDQLGDTGMEIYDQLAKQGGFPWVAIGQDNNLGTEGNYFTIYPFDGDSTSALIAANPHIWKKSEW